METQPSAAVLSLLQRHGLHAHEPQLRALGATTPLHLFQLMPEDLEELDSPPLTEGDRRAFAALLAAGDGDGAAGEDAAPPTEEQLREALRLEDALRTSHDGQRRFSHAETRDDADWLFVAAEMQETALVQAGLRPTSENLDRLRDAALRNPELARYVRHNRCRQGELRVGDRAPNIALVDLAGCASSLLPELAPAQPRRPLVVLAGSYS
jgi:hypothetical protein